MSLELTDHDILLRLRNTEDSTVERKTASDYRDCLKTAVAFSNSLPVDDPGVIFVGVYDDGRAEECLNLDSLQKKVSEEIKKVYPPIYPQQKIMSLEGKEFLAVIVRGSAERPHFAGPAYLRDGSQSISASKPLFDGLVAERNSKARAILEWRGKTVTLVEETANTAGHWITYEAYVVDCNQFYVTVEVRRVQGHGTLSKPLRLVDLTFDHAKGRLELDFHRR